MERREQYRMLVDAQALVTFSDGSQYEAKGIDVSQNGVLLHTQLRPMIGDQVKVELSLQISDDEAITMNGEVVRVEPDPEQKTAYYVGCWVSGFSDLIGSDLPN